MSIPLFFEKVAKYNSTEINNSGGIRMDTNSTVNDWITSIDYEALLTACEKNDISSEVINNFRLIERCFLNEEDINEY